MKALSGRAESNAPPPDDERDGKGTQEDKAIKRRLEQLEARTNSETSVFHIRVVYVIRPTGSRPTTKRGNSGKGPTPLRLLANLRRTL
jgi:hypothetical protein